ncbi:thymidylate synthase [Methanothermobacter wolfeii]|uniref:Putative thymidylate synthase n=1 Tax=Methanothermobacter wolfeii TaxID=145261 RepID=A0A9E7RSU3_METWO|nr:MULTISPECIES: thymidylate synthase [Methanothermobacter]NLM02526.1 thymidylate synthase [Methanothermobacter wolfeii]QHN06547.1 thymidylate synthase [Methanothermobacter sp. THM-1]UXH31080.1 thymidylate synthase [Methanothermobacter wolfeii]SCM57584.1 putative thymidylate synthase {ECO:0000255/HAMAP-Rule:MF_01686} [Methanothermobacter wolfeii]
MAYEITVDEIADGWKKLVRMIMDEGREIRDERGSLTRELMNTVVTIRKPLGKSGDFYHIPAGSPANIRVPEGYFWSGEKLEKYSQQFLSPERKGFIYTYGNRLRSYFGVDQVDEAIKRLKNCGESRRATMVTWDPVKDTGSDEVPCMILVDFKLRDGKLHTTALWRSHDIYGAWFPNAVGLAYLADYVASGVGAGVGPITIHSISAHIYEVNFKEAEEVI